MDEYETVFIPKSQYESIMALDAYADKLGNPQDCSTEAGWKLIDAIVLFWEANYPQEVNDWRHDRKIDLENERDKHVHLYNPVTYPTRLFKLLKIFFPYMSLSDRNFYTKLVKRQALFKSTNYKI
jgi:hypothetical protein